jgi:hypothetical protein
MRKEFRDQGLEGVQGRGPGPAPTVEPVHRGAIGGGLAIDDRGGNGGLEDGDGSLARQIDFTPEFVGNAPGIARAVQAVEDTAQGIDGAPRYAMGRSRSSMATVPQTNSRAERISGGMGESRRSAAATAASWRGPTAPWVSIRMTL